STTPVRFDANSELPDPYDGLINANGKNLHVHDCMGTVLCVDNKPWGVLTLDALTPGTFDQYDPAILQAFISSTEASIKTAELIDALESRVDHQYKITEALMEQQQSQTILGNSKVMETLKQEIKLVAPSDLTVLIQGETGVGKELVAQSIHRLSQRANQAMVTINCAALTQSLAESELFGHEAGAFTGAIKSRPGKFELADGGTLFLDEIGELPMAIQSKLLRALQYGEIHRVGSDQPHKINTRIIAATNRHLQHEVMEGRFRADLYHRLGVFPLTIAPLRERSHDVLLLAGHFLTNQQRRLGVNNIRLSSDAECALLNHNWPGNVRELEHLLSRAALKSLSHFDNNDRVITVEVNELGLQTTSPPDTYNKNETRQHPPPTIEQKGSLKKVTAYFQRNYVQNCLARCNNNISAAARELDLDRSNFYRLIKRLGLR
ncbi:nitric oxide reductase transcriptional regulator NorR, partial [bacterium AH-315-K03]|nr:nitric oxide reductase transcriptional regulator NorR [bacterium AH-315-K03]